MRVVHLPWAFELWMCSSFWILMLMTGLFWREVLSGRYNPEFWDLPGDDGELRDPIPHPGNDTAPQVRVRVRVRKKKSVYDLIDVDGGGSER